MQVESSYQRYICSCTIAARLPKNTDGVISPSNLIGQLASPDSPRPGERGDTLPDVSHTSNTFSGDPSGRTSRCQFPSGDGGITWARK